ncbi:hypothetical protein KY495_15045 [Massilia sp. PAMC28688]|uniref:hypothetical protein n=1 Tax=Massilia sp. PAMC28688 TaxID=2861283 RepID=UPI001C62880B|nr:hypothetical protein [Massilia sp. PAMC28688]QYF92084.1 hypothetical protein KY495_15045 [Massilia sp. PAMC28688]
MNADLTFLLEPDCTLDILEAVLATARRGGLHLGALRVHNKERNNAVHLRVRVGDPHLLDLFELRLNNIIGVHELCRVTVE